MKTLLLLAFAVAMLGAVLSYLDIRAACRVQAAMDRVMGI